MAAAKFVFTELRTNDTQRARSFYSDVLGWKYHDLPGAPDQYAQITSEGDAIGAIADGPGQAQWLGYVGVADVKAATAKARSLGAQVEVDCQAFGDNGTLSVFVDPTGARVALWQGPSSWTRWKRFLSALSG
jgi:predicted enzyme related to lactoylglutathione lyase